MVRAVLLVLTLSLALPAGAAAEQVTQGDGQTTATLSWMPPADEGVAVTGVRLQVTRDGVPVFDGAPEVPRCARDEAGCGLVLDDEGPLVVDDVDGDDAPDVLVRLFTGGAHCCAVTKAFLASGATTSRDFLDAGATLADVDGDDVPEFVSADARLAYAFSSYASSGLPLQILRVRDGRFGDVTARFPGRVRADARRWLRLYRQALRRDTYEPLGPLTAWVADQYTLGRRAGALRFLRAELRRGHLDAGPGTVSGRGFLRRIDRVLARLRYT